MGKKKAKKRVKVEKVDTGVNLTAVLVTHNEQSNIAEAIRSLLNQVVPTQLIVIDDGSTDATPEIIKSFGDRIKETGGQIKLYKTQKGAAVRRNQGNQLAKGDVIMVCDSDLYHKDRSEAVHELFTRYPEKDVFYSGYAIRAAESLFMESVVPVVEWDFNSKCTISHPTVAYKKEWALKHPYIEKSKETDLFEFMLLNMYKDGAQFAVCENTLMKKIEGNTNRDRSKAKELKQEMYKFNGIDANFQ